MSPSWGFPFHSHELPCPLWVSSSLGRSSVGVFQPTLPMLWTCTPSCPTPCRVPALACDQRCQVEVEEVSGQEASPLPHIFPSESLCLQTLYLIPSSHRGQLPPSHFLGKPNPRWAGEPHPRPRYSQGLQGPQERSQCSSEECGWEEAQQVATSCPQGLGTQPKMTLFWSRICSSPGHLRPQPGPGSAAAGGRLGHSRVWGDSIQ